VSLKHSALGLVAMALLSFNLPAAAKIVCCDVNGKRTCGDPAPPQCLNKAQTVFGKGGVAREVEAPLTAEQKAAREVEAARKEEEKKLAAEQVRRDRALLDSYTNEDEIDKARERAVTEIEKNAEQAKNRLEVALRKQEKFEKEKEFYQKKPLPGKLQAQISDNENEIAAQRKALDEKDAGIEAVRARYEADKARYRQLSGKK
jgi:small-conductance mechanosensitive channel